MFDLTKQKEIIIAQPIELEYKFDPIFNVAPCTTFAVVLTNRLKSINSNGQRHFDLFLNNLLGFKKLQKCF